MRTKPVEQGEKPFAWGVSSEKQCTWYAFYESIKRNLYAPCYYDRAKKLGSYTNGKLWLKNYREPYYPIWFSNEETRLPSENDILVFDGNYGHVVIVEEDYNNSKGATISQYNMKSPLEFSNDVWEKGQILKGYPYNTGKPLGFLHLPQTLNVGRNESKDQIKVNTLSQYLRDKPNGNILSYCYQGYFDVLDSKNNGDYTWYKIDKDTWIAGVNGNVEFLPKEKKVNYEELYKAEQQKLNIVRGYLKDIAEVIGK